MRPALRPGIMLGALLQLAQPAHAQHVLQMSRDDILSKVATTFTPYILLDNNRVVVIDFPSLYEQGNMFARVVLFVERHGAPKTRVMSHVEMQQWLEQHSQRVETLTAGNNFRAGQLARFFNTARIQGEALSGDEQRLRDWLVQAAVLHQTGEDLSPAQPEMVIVTLPQASSVPGCATCTVKDTHREVILEHELSHAHFATDDSYREYVVSFWSSLLRQEASAKFTQFLRRRGYNADDQELLANEMQAFLMHTPDAKMFSAAAVGMTDAELDEIRHQFRAGWDAQTKGNAGRQ